MKRNVSINSENNQFSNLQDSVEDSEEIIDEKQ